MSIQSDRWIIEQAAMGMIEPFENSQVRSGVISYGVSSYGYDMRVSNQFKIFTNVMNSLIDPKQFDPNSFVEFEGDVCIVPANSFALACSVEYFRIPRDVVTLCVGKSTYARCFRGDTRVALVDGSTPTLEQMATRAEEGELFWGYSVGQHGRIVVTLLDAPRYIGRDALTEVVLDNGSSIHCTPDHEFLLRDGRVAPASSLRAGDSLMPLYRQLVRGYEAVYQPLNGHLYPTHRLSDEWNLAQGIYADAPGTHRHHRDHDRRNNAPWNIERMIAADHIRHHNAESYGPDFDPAAHGQAISDALTVRAQDEEWRSHYSAVQRERASRFWRDEAYVEARKRLVALRLESWTPARSAEQSAALRAYYERPGALEARSAESRDAWARDDGTRRDRQREIARSIHLRKEITADAVRIALHETGSIRGAARLLDCDRSVFRRFPDILAEVRGVTTEREVVNHKVAGVRELAGDHDVYCLTVPEAGNFALDAGVFVRNCGIITNVTPFEPEWEGYVTLEISNTTPLPAKIYANEGIAQVMFFRGEEGPITSYKDKKGKYQGQQGVTLPRL